MHEAGVRQNRNSAFEGFPRNRGNPTVYQQVRLSQPDTHRLVIHGVQAHVHLRRGSPVVGRGIHPNRLPQRRVELHHSFERDLRKALLQADQHPAKVLKRPVFHPVAVNDVQETGRLRPGGTKQNRGMFRSRGAAAHGRRNRASIPTVAGDVNFRSVRAGGVILAKNVGFQVVVYTDHIGHRKHHGARQPVGLRIGGRGPSGVVEINARNAQLTRRLNEGPIGRQVVVHHQHRCHGMAPMKLAQSRLDFTAVAPVLHQEFHYALLFTFVRLDADALFEFAQKPPVRLFRGASFVLLGSTGQNWQNTRVGPGSGRAKQPDFKMFFERSVQRGVPVGKEAGAHDYGSGIRFHDLGVSCCKRLRK